MLVDRFGTDATQATDVAVRAPVRGRSVIADSGRLAPVVGGAVHGAPRRRWMAPVMGTDGGAAQMPEASVCLHAAGSTSYKRSTT